MTGVIAIWIYISTYIWSSNQPNKIIFLVIYAMLNGLYSFLLSMLVVAKGHFFAQISDKTIGSTYMALLHTFSNIG